jgi:hypothetical protein
MLGTTAAEKVETQKLQEPKRGQQLKNDVRIDTFEIGTVLEGLSCNGLLEKSRRWSTENQRKI